MKTKVTSYLQPPTQQRIKNEDNDAQADEQNYRCRMVLTPPQMLYAPLLG